MKRVKIGPCKWVTVSDEALERARKAIADFGLTPDALKKLDSFKGDILIGPRRRTTAGRLAAAKPRR